MKERWPDFTFVGIDLEFLRDIPGQPGLISMALAYRDKDHRTHSLYVINGDVDQDEVLRRPWMVDNVWSKLPLDTDGRYLDLRSSEVQAYYDIPGLVSDFLSPLTDGESYRQHIGLIADHGTQDVQRLHELWGHDWSPGAMPPWIPKRLFQDLATLEDVAGVSEGRMPDGERLPEMDPVNEHVALWDAVHDLDVLEFLLARSRAVRVACGVELI
jgi:hypothetical protein